MNRHRMRHAENVTCIFWGRVEVYILRRGPDTCGSLHVERTVATVLDSWTFQRMEVSTGILGAEHRVERPSLLPEE